MPKTKQVKKEEHCGWCINVKGSEENCTCHCHSSQEDLTFQLPESQWNATEAEVLTIIDSERSDSV